MTFGGWRIGAGPFRHHLTLWAKRRIQRTAFDSERDQPGLVIEHLAVYVPVFAGGALACAC
jgi:hypothetical protein